ncbi:MAG: WecB/TagA/CpsF family glycosyltransferase [Lachnospirales bacterium]
MEFCKILGVPFANISPNDAVDKVVGFLNDDKKHMVFTPNPEMVMEACKNTEFMTILNKSSMNVPDGIGIVYASKLTGSPIKERVAGYDMLLSVFDKIKDSDKTVYFFGGAPEIADRAKKAIEERFKGIKIVGTANGYFDSEREKEIINEINTLKPDLLLVGIGFPKQEKWIYDHISSLNIKVGIGVGGSFDGWCGNVPRAPEFFVNHGLEWFYRLMKQPSRIGRMMQLPLFMLKVIFYKIIGRLEK